MALREVDPDKPPRHVRTAAKKVGEAARAGKVVPLRSGQRARVRKKKARVLQDAVEAVAVADRANKILGQDVWRLRSIVSEKILYLFVHAENVGGGCMNGVIKMGRYPRLMRWKSGLRYDFLCVIAKPRWDRMTEEEHTQATYHALRHVHLDSDGRRGIEGHDHSGFYSEVEFFGVRSPEVKKIAEQLEFMGLLTKSASKKIDAVTEGGKA